MNLKIYEVESNLKFIDDPKIVQIINLIIDATNAYPKQELDDIGEYLDILRKKTRSKILTKNILIQYSKTIIDNLNNKKEIWIYDSLSSMIEAFELMELYKIDFNVFISILKKNWSNLCNKK